MAVNSPELSAGAVELAKCMTKMHYVLHTLTEEFNMGNATVDIWQDTYGDEFDFVFNGEITLPNEAPKSDVIPGTTPYDCLVGARELLITYFEAYHSIKVEGYRVHQPNRDTSATIQLTGKMRKPKPDSKDVTEVNV